METKKVVPLPFICLILMFVMMILQFCTAWTIDGQGSSVGSYVWITATDDAMEQYFLTHDASFTVAGLALASASCFIMPVLALIFFLRNPEGYGCPICGLICGIIVAYSMLAKTAYRMSNVFIPYLIISVVLMAASAISLRQVIKANR